MSPTLLIDLSWRFSRSARQVRTAAPLAICACVLTLVFVCLNAFSLSGTQQADRDLGTHDHAFSDSAPFGDEMPRSYLDGLRAAVSEAGAEDPATQIFSFDVVPDALPEQFNTGVRKTVTYSEQPNLSAEFPGSYQLESGEWPRHPGEVVLSASLADELGDPGAIEVFSGAASLAVTGAVLPTYGEDSWRIIGADGTWTSLPAKQILQGFPAAGGSVRIFWSAHPAPWEVARAVHAATVNGQRPAQLMTGHLSRADIISAGGDRPLTERMPLVLTYPSVLLTALIGLLIVNLNRSRLVEYHRRLTGVGMRARPLRWAMTVSLAVDGALAGVAGCVVGLLLGVLARVAVLPGVITQPLSPMPSPWVAVGRMLAVAIAAIVLASLVRLRTRHRLVDGAQRVAGAIPWPLIRRGAAVLAIAWGLPMASRAADLDGLAQGAAWLLVGLLLMAPDLLRGLTRLLPLSRAIPLTARRLMEHDRARYAVAVTALATCIGLPTAVATFVATETRTETAKNVSQVPDGQVVVDVADSNPTTAAAVRDLVTSVPGVANPVRVSTIFSTTKTIRFARDGEHGAFGIWVVASSDDLEAILGGPLAGSARKALETGGVVDWSGATGTQQISIQANGEAPRLTESLPTAHIKVNESSEFAAAGAMLETTADALELPSQPSKFVFTGLEDDTIRTAVNIVTAAGYAARYVAFHVTPPPTKPTSEWYAAAGGLTLAGFLVLWFVLRGQARHLREYAARLLALGLQTGWSAKVLLLQAALTVVAGLLLGLAAGAVPVALFATTAFDGIILDIPATYVAVTVVTSLSAAALGSVTSLWALRPAQE